MIAGIIRPGIAAETRLDRRGDRRTDTEWVRRRLHSPEARVLLLIDLKVPILPSEADHEAAVRWLTPDDKALKHVPAEEFIFLGERDGASLFAANLAPYLPEADAIAEAFRPCVDLRSLAVQGALPNDELLIAAQARAICAWHAVSLCCGRCGARTLNADAGWRRQCRACGLNLYPRTDPAVIMLITRGDACLLGSEHRFPERMYSTLAGFVEAGDDIENAVRREVKEEAGITVGEVRYVASQPWPFPHSLMIGCWGAAESDEIRLDASELRDVRWFSREEVREMIEGRHPDGLFVPPPISMAHVLIRGFLAGTLC